MLVLFNSLKYFLSRLQASRRILKKARLVRSQRSPKQLPSVSKTSFPWQRKEQIALIQFIALFGELKKEGSEWPTFGNRHEHWNKAADFVQDTAGTEFRRSDKFIFRSSSNLFFNEIYLVYTGLFSFV